jgi:hypothetical protein
MAKYYVHVSRGNLAASFWNIEANSKEEAKEKGTALFREELHKDLYLLDIFALEEKEPPKKWEKGKFHYILETNMYCLPEYLAEGLSFSPDIKYFVSIIDLQNGTHKYGNIYVISHEKKR